MKTLDLLFAARPMLHIPVWTVFLITLHYHHELTGDSFDWRDLLMIVSLNLVFAGAYYINQVFDVRSDAINKKLGFFKRWRTLHSPNRKIVRKNVDGRIGWCKLWPSFYADLFF